MARMRGSNEQPHNVVPFLAGPHNWQKNGLVLQQKNDTKNGRPQSVLTWRPQTNWENIFLVEPRQKDRRRLRRWKCQTAGVPQHRTWLETAQSPGWPGAFFFAIPTSTVELLTLCPMSFRDRSFELGRV